MPNKTPVKAPQNALQGLAPARAKRIDTRDVKVSVVAIGPRQRAISEAVILEKVQSMGEAGQITPIALRIVSNEYILIAGAHRLEAAKRLGWETIRAEVWECDDEAARLLEMDENLAGTKLTVLDIALSLSVRKEMYEAANPLARNGGERGNQHTGGKKRQMEIISFCQSISAQLGWSDRHVRNLVALGARARETMDGRSSWAEALRGTSAENHFVELREFYAKDVSDSARVRMLARLKDAENPARSVRHAFRTLDGQEPARLSQDQRDYDAFRGLMDRMSPRVRAAALYWAATGLKGQSAFNWASEKAEAKGAPSAPLDLDAFPFPLPEGRG